MLKETGGEVFAGGGDHTTAVEGLYRYKGTYEEVTNNYICLGDEDSNTCKTNKDNMYRIIGVTDGTEENDLGLEKGMLKVIKATLSNKRQTWATNSTSNIDWDNAGNTVRTYLNTTFYNRNTIDTRIKPYIVEVNWWKGDNTNDSPMSETKISTSAKYRIGLMYASDYYNSWAYADIDNPNTNSWLNICHGLSSGSPSCNSEVEWTMTRNRIVGSGGEWGADQVFLDGYLTFDQVDNTWAVRPVFYLKSNVKLLGSGTESNPFTIYDEPKQPLEALQSKTSEEYLKTVADNDELLRYVGTYEDVNAGRLNNFICFGTTDIPTCTGSEKQTYMYRIIGITIEDVNRDLGLEANQLKIIRAYPSNQSQMWHSSNSVDAKWDGTDTVSDVQIYLNDTFLPTEKAKWKNTYWEEIITSPYWYIGDNNIYPFNATNETGKSAAVHKVGLMYASDYYNAGATNTTNWLFIANGMSGSPTNEEWTMTRKTSGYAWYVRSDGDWYNGFNVVTSTRAVRPVFYLIPDIKLTGSGTESNPFIISVE